MALDTLEKKLSLLDWGDIGGSDLPFPDGILDQGDNQHFLNSYSGILWQVAIPGYREIFLADSRVVLGLAGDSIVTLLKEFDSIIEI